MASAAIPSTCVQSTSGFTAPSTQNTAPVLDFRCLYTHDLRRKAKRWQDGILRFHTFNKRVMVYDIPRNYIGDTHWREDCPVQDGDELQLEKGVLIQVGEATGRVDQDLSGILEKRKKAPEIQSNGPPSPQPGRVSTARPTAMQLSHLRPKSLNALLGTPKGRIGRAALPTKSPHDLRNEKENPREVNADRPAKRQRVESQAERRKPSTPIVPSLQKLPSRNENMPSMPSMNISDQNTMVHTGKSPSSTTQVAGMPAHSRQSVTKPKIDKKFRQSNKEIRTPRKSSKVWSEQEAESSDNAAPRSRKQQRQSPGLRNPEELQTLQTTFTNGNITSHTAAVSDTIEVVSEDEGLSIMKEPREKLKLRMALRKPRKKLMYKDLLSRDVSILKPSSSGVSSEDIGSRHGEKASIRRKIERSTLSSLHQDEQDHLTSRLKRHHANASRLNDLSLFLSQEETGALSTEHERSRENPGKVPDNMSRSTAARNSKTPTSPIPQLEPSIPNPPSTVHDTNLALSKMDEILLSRSRSLQSRHPLSSRHPEPIPTIQPHSGPPSSIPITPPETFSHTPMPRPVTPKTQVPSSPGFQTETPSRPTSIPAAKTTTLSIPPPKAPSPMSAPSSDPTSPNRQPPDAPPRRPSSPSPTSPPQLQPILPPSPPLQTSPEPPSAKSSTTSPPNLALSLAYPPPKLPKPLPSFKPLVRKPRSPLRKAASDVSILRPPRDEASPREGANEPLADAWSKEAWDLFGCGRDGVMVGYGEFKGKE